MNATVQYQREFAAHLRNPAQNPIPAGVNPTRIGVYVDLLFNNLDDFLSGHLPITHHILSATALPTTQWHSLVRQFYAEYACQSPHVRDISGEFVQWFSGCFAEHPLRAAYPYLLELVHYEWVEIPLMLNDTVVDWAHATTITPATDLLDTPLRLNSVMLLQSYQYPVHKISAEWHPSAPEPVFLLLLRNPTGKVETITLNTVTARFVELLQMQHTTRQAITLIAEEISYPDHTQLLQFGLQLLAQFREQHVIIGVSPLDT